MGAGVSASTTAIQGGTWRDIGRSALSGAATGAVTAGVAHGLGEYLAAEAGKQFTAQLGRHLLHAAAHGVTGGAMSAAMGGSFKDGFIGSAAGAFLSPLSGAMGLGVAGTPGWQGFAARTVVASAIGGTASVLGGGKFASGAITAAFLHMYNDEYLSRKSLGLKDRLVSRRFMNNARGIGNMMMTNYEMTLSMEYQNMRLGRLWSANGGGIGVNGYYTADDPTMYWKNGDYGGGYEGAYLYIKNSSPLHPTFPTGYFHKNEVNYYGVGIAAAVDGLSGSSARQMFSGYYELRHPFASRQSLVNSHSWFRSGYKYAIYRRTHPRFPATELTVFEK